MRQRFTSRHLSQEFTAEYDHATGELTIYAPGSRFDMSAPTVKSLYTFLCEVMHEDNREEDKNLTSRWGNTLYTAFNSFDC